MINDFNCGNFIVNVENVRFFIALLLDNVFDNWIYFSRYHISYIGADFGRVRLVALERTEYTIQV